MKLFFRIFFCFWMATILMIGFVLSVSEIMPITFPGDLERHFEPESITLLLDQAMDAYEARGLPGLKAELGSLSGGLRTSLFLFDASGHLIVGDPSPPAALVRLAADVERTQRIKVVHFGFRMLFIGPVRSSSGRHYIAIITVFEPIYRLVNPRFWFNLTIAMVPAALVCVLLTFYITRPITKLRSAAHRLADGELSARAGPLRFDRRDELGELARDFDAMAAQIESLMTAQRRFVADVSHELGGPLTRMHLALALLRRDNEGEESSAVTRMERETNKLSSLVQQLLLLAGLEAGRHPTEILVQVSIGSMCESIIEDACFEAEHRNCRIVGKCEDVMFFAYPNLLRRAIDNVLRNAIRYSPPDSEIVLSCTVDTLRREVTIAITDHGQGVPEKMLGDIFKPFFRTAPGRETSSGGTGLGLSIASEAVRFHGGTIAAQNVMGGGLHVSIKVPLRDVPDEPEMYQV